MPAGELLAALGEGVYVHLAIAKDETELKGQADRYRAVALEGEAGDYPADAFAIDLTLVPASAAPIATRLSDAIQILNPDPTEPVQK